MKHHLRLLFALALLLLPALALAAGPKDMERPDLARLFTAQGLDGCFAVETGDGPASGMVRVNPARCARPFRPHSTFKILNALTAFETGAAPDPTRTMQWDGREREFPAWNRDLTLAEAFRVSAVWYFVELGRRNGRKALAETMRRLDYGTADASGSEQFWIDGPLRVSADQHVRALGLLARGGGGFAPRSLAMLRQVMFLDKGAGPDGEWRLYGKTGLALAKTDAEPVVGWFVGWVERPGRVIPFALNVSQAGDPGAPLTPAQVAARLDISKALLRELGVISK